RSRLPSSSAVVPRLTAPISRPRCQSRDVVVIVLARGTQRALEGLHVPADENVGGGERVAADVRSFLELAGDCAFNVHELAEARRLLLVPALKARRGRGFENARVEKQPAHIFRAVIVSRQRTDLLLGMGVGEIE